MTTCDQANPDFDPDRKFVSGPTNVVRLEGDVAGIKKVLYVFFDYHVPFGSQTKCTNIFAPDVNNYFSTSFRTLNDQHKMYDFFMEIRPSQFTKVNEYENHDHIYLLNLVVMFNKIFSYDTASNQVKVSDVFQKVRLHYLDIRNYLTFVIDLPAENLENTYRAKNILYYGELNDVISKLTNIQKRLGIITSIFVNPRVLPTDYSVFETKYDNDNVIHYSDNDYNPNVFYPNIFVQLVRKIKENYNNQSVQRNLMMILEKQIEIYQQVSTLIETTIDQCQNMLNDLKKTPAELMHDQDYLKKMFTDDLRFNHMRSTSIEILNNLYLIQKVISSTCANITDVYMLRRFLDKSYITNAISYSGAHHSENYVRYLVHYFGFKITHVAYSKLSDIKSINEEVKLRTSNGDTIEDIFTSETLDQCSDLTSFPDKFL